MPRKPVQSVRKTLPRQSSPEGGGLLGATLGTFIFPGVGTAIGCATVSLGSWTWAKFRTPEAVQPKECNTKEVQSKLPSSEEIALNSRTGGKP
jgi:hypothetical protein